MVADAAAPASGRPGHVQEMATGLIGAAGFEPLGLGSRRGRLIAFEGIDGVGKTTQSRILAERIGALYTWEPGSTPLGRAVREVVLARDELAISAEAESLLMLADRAQHVSDVVRPALEAGRWVVSDRFVFSTLAYQGYGRGLDLGILEELCRWSTGGLWPDLNVLLVLDEQAAAERLDAEPDRLESDGRDFFEKVQAGYLKMAAADPDRWVVFYADLTVEELAREIETAVLERLSPNA